MRKSNVLFKAYWLFLIAVGFKIQFLIPQSLLAQVTPSPVDANLTSQYPYNVTALLYTSDPENNKASTCSGAVIQQPTLMMSAAHCVFDIDALKGGTSPWKTTPLYLMRWNKLELPALNDFQSTTGYYFYSGYSTLVAENNDSVAGFKPFQYDQIAIYRYTAFDQGRYGGYYNDGPAALLSSGEKLIVGYPAGLYQYPNYLMHATGPFLGNPATTYAPYHQFTDISIGPGNSGGPVFVKGNNGQWGYAGTAVSGLSKILGADRDLVGIRVFDKGSLNLLESALSAVNQQTQPTPTSTPTPITPAAVPSIEVESNGESLVAGQEQIYRSDNTNFGSVPIKRRIIKKYIVGNVGESDLHLSDVSIENTTGRKAFSIVLRPADLIQPEYISYLRIKFTPPTRRRHRATVRIASNDPESPIFSFVISGVGK